MIPRYTPLRRSRPIRPVTRDELKAHLAKAEARRQKRLAKRTILWPNGAKAMLGPVRAADKMRGGPNLFARRKPASLFKIMSARLDALWGLLVRRLSIAKYGNVCRIGKAKRCAGVVQCGYHLLSKGRGHAIRWALEAGVGACHACNKGEQMNRQLYAEYHEELFGREFMDRLKALARTKLDLGVPGVKDKIEDFKRQLEQFGKPQFPPHLEQA